MAKNLVIVESPAKAKTIEKFLGKDFEVLSSYGHIRDLKKKDFSVDIEHNYKPIYEIPADKKKLVETLKQEADKADMVWLASDEDREGEAIAWHLYEVLKLKPENTKRIVFHEITKSAILKAIEQPRDIDINLVNAQQARRILDRIVGFELSPVLWRKVKPALSAGRVQSVAVRLIVEREREIHAFKSEAAYRVTAVFLVPDTDGKLVEMKAELAHRIKTKKEATPAASPALAEQLESIIMIQPIDENRAQRTIYEIAEDQYAQVNNSQYETEKLRRFFKQMGYISELTPDIIRKSVSQIEVRRKAVTLILKNGQAVSNENLV